MLIDAFPLFQELGLLRAVVPRVWLCRRLFKACLILRLDFSLFILIPRPSPTLCYLLGSLGCRVTWLLWMRKAGRNLYVTRTACFRWPLPSPRNHGDFASAEAHATGWLLLTGERPVSWLLSSFSFTLTSFIAKTPISAPYFTWPWFSISDPRSLSLCSFLIGLSGLSSPLCLKFSQWRQSFGTRNVGALPFWTKRICGWKEIMVAHFN